MKKLYIIIITTVVVCFHLNAQSIPINSCAIRYTYDYAGNRTTRDYFCANGLIAKTLDSNHSYQLIDAIFPNPTTGKFQVTFSEKLDGATVQIISAQGAVIIQTRFNGFKADFDLSKQAAGVYFVVIRNGKNTTSFKVVKQ